MSLNEAKKLAKIISTADGGCEYCVRNLVDLCNVAFPDHKFTYNEYVVSVKVR